MADNTRILTIQDLSSEQQVLRLRLTRAAEDLRHKRGADRTFVEKTTQWLHKLFNSENIEVNIEEGADADTTERNQQRIRQCFERMRKDMDEQQDNVLRAMEGMTPTQQEGVVMFWEEAYKFLLDVIQWIKDVFNKILEKIKQGWRLIKEVVKGFFADVYALIKAVF